MAYSITFSPSNMRSPTVLEDGRVWTMLITQVEVDPADPAEHEWELEVPPLVTVVEYRVEVTNDASGAVTGITPQLGLVEDWVEDTLEHLLTLTPDPAGLYASSFERPAFAAPGGVLRGRAEPNAAGGTIVTRITLAEGIL